MRRNVRRVLTLAAASAGRIAWKVVGIVSVFPNSSSAAPLRPAWSGYAGLDNPLFYRDNTAILLGDAKRMIKRMMENIVKAM